MGRWTRHHTRRLILVVCVVSIGTFLVLHGAEGLRELRNRLAMRELQRQCMLHEAPRDQLVYDDNQTTLRSLKEADSALGWFTSHNHPHGRTFVARVIKPLTEYCHYADNGFPLPLFLHGRRDSSRRERLVFVNFSGREESGMPNLVLTSASQAPITPWGYPEMFVRDYRIIFPRRSNATPIRFYAGQPDPVDPTRFVLSFEIEEQRGEIEGILDDDGFVTLKLLSGPGDLSFDRQR